MFANVLLKSRESITLASLTSVLLLAVLAAAQPAAAQRTSNQTLCFPNVAWFANNYDPPTVTPPVIDGIVSSDRGWQGGFRWVDLRNDGTAGQGLATVAIQGVQDSNYIYLSFEAHKGTQELLHDDTIVLGLDLSTATTPNYLYIIIFPVYNDGQGATGSYYPQSTTPRIPGITFEYYVNGTQVATPAWLTQTTDANVAATSSIVPDNYYDLEMRIPLASVPVPATPFGLYFDVISNFKAGFNSNSTEALWPENEPGQTGSPSSLPNPSSWGNGSLTGVCNGVDIPPGSIVDITAAYPSGSTVLDPSPSGNNQFQVTPTNSTMSPSGQPVLAPQVTASFLISNWGFANNWIPINPAMPILPNDLQNPNTTSFSTNWTVPAADQAKYQAHPHQCIEVQLDAKPPSTTGACAGQTQTTAPWCYAATFIHSAAVQNMNFPDGIPPGTMFRGFIAQIGTYGFTLPPGQQDQVFDFHIRTLQPQTFYRQGSDAAKAAPMASTAGVGQSLLWALHGYRHTGQFINIHGNSYEVLSYAGSFGYGLHYAKGQPAWRFQLFGENGDKVSNLGTNLYQMHVKQGGVGYVNATFEGDPQAGSGGPVNAGGCSMLHRGATVVFPFGILIAGAALYWPRRRR